MYTFFLNWPHFTRPALAAGMSTLRSFCLLFACLQIMEAISNSFDFCFARTVLTFSSSVLINVSSLFRFGVSSIPPTSLDRLSVFCNKTRL
jgi:hypothetical protein